jgi:hypothetical protein
MQHVLLTVIGQSCSAGKLLSAFISPIIELVTSLAEVVTFVRELIAHIHNDLQKSCRCSSVHCFILKILGNYRIDAVVQASGRRTVP